MVEFLYKVKDGQGRVQEAVAQADSLAILKARLVARGVEVVEIRPRKGTTSGANAGGDWMKRWQTSLEKVQLRDLVIFTRQFSSMVGSGVAMLRTLAIMTEQSENPKLKRTIDTVRKSVEGGSSLSDALVKFPDVFDRLYVAMVRAGEAGGILDEVLSRLADFLEEREKLNAKVKSAMVYPSAVMGVAILVFWGMLTFILPVFQNMFKTLGGELPAFTQFLVYLSEFMRSAWMLLMVGAVVGSVIGIKSWYKTDAGKLKLDGMMLKAPGMGDLLKKVAITRFTRTFGTLVKSGVPMLTALEVVKDTAGNAVVKISIENIQNEVRQGGTLSSPLSKDPLFPAMVTQMIAVGEETGRLDDMLSKVADFYDQEVERAVDAFTALLEPIMVVGIGGIVGSVVVGMYLPIFSIINKIQ